MRTMSLEGKEYLEEIVNSVICIPDVFRIHLEDGKYIFSIHSKEQHIDDYYAVSAIYDTIVDLDNKVKHSFSQAITCNLSETLDGYDPFSKLKEEEFIAMYHIENMVYRVSILWDLLAQLCNVIFHTELEASKINCNRYFDRFSLGENSIEIAKEVRAYFDEEEDTAADINPWPGNHAYLNEYRNQMTHRVTPSITTISSFGSTLRPPAMYLLHRVTEDYYKVSSFLCRLINEFLEDCKDKPPVIFLDEEGDKK